MKDFKEMDSKDFQLAKRKAETQKFSPFAQFMMDLKGYDLFIEGVKQYKFEVYNSGRRNTSALIAGEGTVYAVKRESGEESLS